MKASETLMRYDPDEYLMMSGLQHFCFCRRQWALIHLEQQWEENRQTAEGRLDHTRCHDADKTEKRGDLIIMRGMRVVSHRLRLSGVCDVVEFRSNDDGISLSGYEGKWDAVPVEYKHGHSKENDADRIQLCAQAIALEEMLQCEISIGILYYAETRKREAVHISNELREKTQRLAGEMNSYNEKGYTPKVRTGKSCRACSLKDICLPELNRKVKPDTYIKKHILVNQTDD